MAIVDLLTGKTYTERADIKSVEIAKLNLLGEYLDGNLKIEIQSLTKIKEGIQVLARAWKDNVQLGFGVDGSVEIERFRIYNPPIMVPDGTTTTLINEFGYSYQHHNKKEDPVEAIRRTLAHIIFLVGKENSNIVIGKVGNTTSTFFPDANVESTSVDGHAVHATASQSFATKRAGNGTGADDSGALITFGRLLASTTTDTYSDMRRAFFLFDTSTIPDTDTIDSGTFSFVVEAGNVVNGLSLSCSLVGATIASNTAVAAADFQGTVGNVTRFATDKTYASLTADGTTYNDWTLNASGLAAISKTGVTKFGGKVANDVDNSAPTWISAADSYANVNSADLAGTSEDPKLVVVHTSNDVNVSVFDSITLTEDVSILLQSFALRNLGFISNNLRPRIFAPGNAR